MGGIGPLIADGYGTFYGIRPRAYKFCITAWRASGITSVTLLAEAIFQSMRDMALLFPSSSL